MGVIGQIVLHDIRKLASKNPSTIDFIDKICHPDNYFLETLSKNPQVKSFAFDADLADHCIPKYPGGSDLKQWMTCTVVVCVPC